MGNDIKKFAVLGSGVMGSGIAAHIANAGYPVVLLDIVPKGEQKNRNVLAEKAVEKQLATRGFIHKDRAKLVKCGNIEDHLHLLSDCDWIVEAVLENPEIKHDIYSKIDKVRKPGSVVSSNTSTIPLAALVKDMSDAFKKDFMIAHFFNPVRYMRLLEMIKGKDTRKDGFDAACKTADVLLGKGLVMCKDTPGFIANRVGIYWLMLGLTEAMRLGITPEQADAVMSKPVGIPGTGVFGLWDLIGIDLMGLIIHEMVSTTVKTDPYQAYKQPDLVKNMVATGYTGRKGKGGFYRIVKNGAAKISEVVDLKTGEYHVKPEKIELASLAASKDGLRALFDSTDIGGQYAWAVLSGTLTYAASLIPEIADDISAVDDAMRMGYAWKYGPFELLDRMSTPDMTGGDWFAAKLKAEGRPVPALIAKAAGKKFYATEGGKHQQFNIGGKYTPMIPPAGSLMLDDIKLVAKPVAQNPSASVWDLGDGIACLELTSKMNAVDPDIIAMMEQLVPLVKKDFKGLVIGNDADNFSVGANIKLFLDAANKGDWNAISEIIQRGHAAMLGLKYAPFPVVASLAGMALGGGCELVLHSNAVQAYVESSPGLVEINVGLIPGWGGCKEMLLRHQGVNKGEALPVIARVFEYIAMARTATSAEDARDMRILRDGDAITMNRVRVLADAKACCLKMANGYSAPKPATINLPGAVVKEKLFAWADGLLASKKCSPHDVVVMKVLANVVTGGNTDITKVITEQQLMDLELEGFMELVKTPATIARIDNMLKTGKPLKN